LNCLLQTEGFAVERFGLRRLSAERLNFGQIVERSSDLRGLPGGLLNRERLLPIGGGGIELTAQVIDRRPMMEHGRRHRFAIELAGLT